MNKFVKTLTKPSKRYNRLSGISVLLFLTVIVISIAELRFIIFYFVWIGLAILITKYLYPLFRSDKEERELAEPTYIVSPLTLMLNCIACGLLFYSLRFDLENFNSNIPTSLALLFFIISSLTIRKNKDSEF